MAILKDSSASFVSAETISSPTNGVSIKTDMIDSESRYLRQAKAVYSSTGIGVETGWTTRTDLSELMSGFNAGSLVHLHYYIPARNDSQSWGGLYIEPQVEFNSSGSWNSLGCSGYDGGVMVLRAATIASYMNSILIDPDMTSEFSVKFRFAFRSYDGTTDVNGRHAVNSVSGTAPVMSGLNGNQHWSHILVEEYALWN